jgi:hypothetical protein
MLMPKRLAKYLVVVAALAITIGILDRVFLLHLSRYCEASLEVLARERCPAAVAEAHTQADRQKSLAFTLQSMIDHGKTTN